MADNEDYLMRGVGTAYQYESLLDGSLTMLDIARIHDWLDVKIENELRYKEAMDRGR